MRHPACTSCGGSWSQHMHGCRYDDPATRRLNARTKPKAKEARRG
jgi:hypothetical protein